MKGKKKTKKLSQKLILTKKWPNLREIKGREKVGVGWKSNKSNWDTSRNSKIR